MAEKPSAVPAEVPAPEPSPEETFEAEAAESRAEMDEPFDLPEAEIEVDIRDDRDDAAESLIRWAAARAGLIVVAPVLGTAALMANEVYMIVRLGETYGVKLSDKVVLSFIGSLGGTAAGSLAHSHRRHAGAHRGGRHLRHRPGGAEMDQRRHARRCEALS